MPQPKLKVQLKKFHPDARVPEYKSDMAAAFDLHACLPYEQRVQLVLGETLVIPTGIGIFLNHPDYCLEIWERSGLGARGIARRAGLVDADYQGAIGVVLTNHTEDLLTIHHGDRIAQAKVALVQRVHFEEVEEFDVTTQRGSGAWGSTGIR
jgi:dUTP pyrophosphatase